MASRSENRVAALESNIARIKGKLGSNNARHKAVASQLEARLKQLEVSLDYHRGKLKAAAPTKPKKG